MSDSAQEKKRTSDIVDKVVRYFREVCDAEKIPAELILTYILKREGYKVPKLERQVPLKLTEDVKIFLYEFIREITKKIAEEVSKNSRSDGSPKIMDRSLAQYIVEYTLLSYGCEIEGHKAKKKDIDAFMGFSERTMRHQQKIYNSNFSESHTIESKFHYQLLKELRNIALLQ